MNQQHQTIDSESSSLDVTRMLQALSRPEAFPFALPPGQIIPVIHTHASIVLLTPMLVYKLKKPKNFGFFDYSTPMQRRHFCIQEVLVNSRFAPGIYIGVAPVVYSNDGYLSFGQVLPVNKLPLPGSALGEGTVVDYAVVMQRLPDEATLEFLVQTGVATSEQLARVGRYVATFHTTAPTSAHIAHFGSLDVVRQNWEENFAQMQPLIGRTLEGAVYERIVTFARHFMQERTRLFELRIRDGYIRDCHGDLRLQHVYLLDTRPVKLTQSLPPIVILDGIEFNERFRYSDVVAEVAFLAMELDAASRNDLARAFVDAYVAATGDDALRELLPFYCCYRACVRGKVLSFQLEEVEVPEAQRLLARQQAANLFALAAEYATGPTVPLLIMIGGLMGTGKSTLARQLHHELGWPLFSSDIIRKRLAHLDPSHPQADAFEQGLYSLQWTERTYQALQEEASTALAQGRSVLLDASFSRRAERLAMSRVARLHGASAIFVECICPAEIVLQRLERRWLDRIQQGQQGNASDGRPELYMAQSARWEPFDEHEEAERQHLLVSTAQPPTSSCAELLAALHIPHFSCPLQLSK